MAKSECAYGHIYDSDIYPSCPYCSGGNRVDLGGATADVNGFSPTPETFYAGPQPDMNNRRTVMDDSVTVPVTGGGFSVTDDNETMPPKGYDKQKVTDAAETVSMYEKKINADPVVGWLVCLNGKNKGTDYRLLARQNTIGRSDSNDVSIKDDPAISRDDSVRLAYDYKHNSFYLIPDKTKNDVYLNDDPVYVPAAIKAYDRIEIGETQLIFVPLCNEQFKWEDEKKEEK